MGSGVLGRPAESERMRVGTKMAARGLASFNLALKMETKHCSVWEEEIRNGDTCCVRVEWS